MPAVRAAALACLPDPERGNIERVPGTGAARKAGFGRDRRIRTSAEFEALLRGGMRRSAGGFSFFFARRAAGPARLGILISRKHAALATDRNRIKRCIREAFRQQQHTLGSLDILVRPPFGLKPTAATLQLLRGGLDKLPK